MVFVQVIMKLEISGQPTARISFSLEENFFNIVKSIKAKYLKIVKNNEVLEKVCTSSWYNSFFLRAHLYI